MKLEVGMYVRTEGLYNTKNIYIFKEILQKYKSIIGVSDENSKN